MAIREPVVGVAGEKAGASELRSTFVFRHSTEAEATAHFAEMSARWHFADAEAQGTRIIAWSAGDAMSVADAARMALDCRDLDQSERMELAADLLELTSWEECRRKFAEWELEESEGALVDAPTPPPVSS